MLQVFHCFLFHPSSCTALLDCASKPWNVLFASSFYGYVFGRSVQFTWKRWDFIVHKQRSSIDRSFVDSQHWIGLFFGGNFSACNWCRDSSKLRSFKGNRRKVSQPQDDLCGDCIIGSRSYDAHIFEDVSFTEGKWKVLKSPNKRHQ